MSLRIIRKADGATYVDNASDARALCHAFGQNGIIHGYGSNCTLTVDTAAPAVSIGTGEFMFYGWQIAFEGATALSVSDGGGYYTFYIKLDLSTIGGEAVSVLSLRNTSEYPSVPSGDNLISVSRGVGYIGLCRAYVTANTSGTVTAISAELTADYIYAGVAPEAYKLCNINTSFVHVSKSECQNHTHYLPQNHLYEFHLLNDDGTVCSSGILYYNKSDVASGISLNAALETKLFFINSEEYYNIYIIATTVGGCLEGQKQSYTKINGEVTSNLITELALEYAILR